MSIEKLNEFLKQNEAPAELLKFAESLKQVDLETVKGFLENDEAGKQYLKSRMDSFTSKAIETFKEKTMPGLIDEKIKELNPEETEEQKRLRKLEDENAKFQREVKREKLLNKAISYAQEKSLPTKLVDRFLGDDEETTINNINSFGEIYSEAINKAVESKFKENGRENTPGDNGENKDSGKSFKTFADWKKDYQN